MSIGKKDGVTPTDLVGALTKELRVDRTAIGRVELRDGFCLIELPAADADRIAQALSGKMIRKVRVTARLDRTPGAAPSAGLGAAPDDRVLEPLAGLERRHDRCGSVMVLPVRGLRIERPARRRTSKLPKPVICTAAALAQLGRDQSVAGEERVHDFAMHAPW